MDSINETKTESDTLQYMCKHTGILVFTCHYIQIKLKIGGLKHMLGGQEMFFLIYAIILVLKNFNLKNHNFIIMYFIV